jgi:uncharacterized coiled-coil protein SlyX
MTTDRAPPATQPALSLEAIGPPASDRLHSPHKSCRPRDFALARPLSLVSLPFLLLFTLSPSFAQANSAAPSENVPLPTVGHVAPAIYSDGRNETDIKDSDLGLDFIEKLRPVSFRYNNGDETLRYGFIAQEVEAALPVTLRDMVEKSKPTHGISLVVREHNAEGTYQMTYDDLISPLVKSVQQLKAARDEEHQQVQTEIAKNRADLEQQISVPASQVADLKKAIADHQQEIEDLRRQISNLASQPQK